jgi:hypothetical protein
VGLMYELTEKEVIAEDLNTSLLQNLRDLGNVNYHEKEKSM